MSIIACPGCSKRISSLTSICPHCGLARGEVNEEDLLVYQMRQTREKIYRLNMISYAVITVFVAAFGWFWWSTGGFQHPSSTGPIFLVGPSAVGYLAMRVMPFMARSRLKQLKRNQS